MELLMINLTNSPQISVAFCNKNFSLVCSNPLYFGQLSQAADLHEVSQISTHLNFVVLLSEDKCLQLILRVQGQEAKEKKRQNCTKAFHCCLCPKVTLHDFLHFMGQHLLHGLSGVQARQKQEIKEPSYCQEPKLSTAL